MTHMLGWKSVPTVAEHPAAHDGKAGKPLPESTAPGIAAPVLSIVRSVLYGLKAAELLVEPPSAACHSSRSATLAAVAGAPTPSNTHSSHPGGNGVKPPPCADAGPPVVQANAPRPSPAVARARTNPTLRKMRVMRGRSEWVTPPVGALCTYIRTTTTQMGRPRLARSGPCSNATIGHWSLAGDPRCEKRGCSAGGPTAARCRFQVRHGVEWERHGWSWVFPGMVVRLGTVQVRRKRPRTGPRLSTIIDVAVTCVCC